MIVLRPNQTFTAAAYGLTTFTCPLPKLGSRRHRCWLVDLAADTPSGPREELMNAFLLRFSCHEVYAASPSCS